MKPSSRRSAPLLRERLGAAVDHLEGRLAEELDLEGAARASGFSRSHFMRLFQAAVGYPVAGYVRRRRLSRAAEALAAGRPVLETAVEWGYGSQAAFTRAFSRVFGVTPAAYGRGVRSGRSPVEVLVRYEPRLPPAVRLTPSVAQAEKAPLRLSGICARVSARRFQSLDAVAALWARLSAERWRALGRRAGAQIYGLSRLHASGDLEYVVGVELAPGARAPAGLRVVEVPGGPYAVFASVGTPAAIARGLVLAAYGGWFRRTRVQRRPGAWDVEAFEQPELPDRAQRCELWVPLRSRDGAPA